MTESKAIKILNTFPVEDEMYETAQLAINAIERLIARKPTKDKYVPELDFCPECGTEVTNCNYCPHCGQKIDWNE